MKKLINIAVVVVVVLALIVNAIAINESEADTVTGLIDGQKQVIKTYTVSPETNPQELIEEPFEVEGYRFSFVDMTKEEVYSVDKVTRIESVTVETDKKDFVTVLGAMPPSMEYDDGMYSGTLIMDHTTIQTKVSGYANGSRSITAEETIGPLDRNDMSYIPATIVKDGNTLALSNVEWQIIETELVGEVLIPSAYRAIATYTGQELYRYITGYASTAQYVGEVFREFVESITYQVIYLGEKISEGAETPPKSDFWESLIEICPYILSVICLVGIAGMGAALAVSRREILMLKSNNSTRLKLKEEDEK